MSLNEYNVGTAFGIGTYLISNIKNTVASHKPVLIKTQELASIETINNT